MAKNQKATPGVDKELAYIQGVAKNLVDRLYGPAGLPWGTKFTELEATVAAVREALTEAMLHQALARQAAQVERPPEYDTCPACGRPTLACDPPEPRRLETGAGDAVWAEPKTRCQKCRRDFFPQSKSLGIDRSHYSPNLQRKIVYAGTAQGSFQLGQQALQELAEVAVTTKLVERLTEQIGNERLAERHEAVAAFEALPLTEKHQSPAGVTSPKVGVVMVDGGRVQILERGANAKAPHEDEDVPAGRDRGKHWREDKAALLLTVDSDVSANDPCPEIPATFVDPTRILKLAREIHAVSAGQDGVTEPEDQALGAAEASDEQAGYEPPVIVSRQVVASRRRWPDFAPVVAQAARTAGLLGAGRRAFVADGSDNNWAIQRRFFGSWTAILDFIHALSYVFAAATAGRTFAEGWPVYVRWITWLWQGQAEQVIVELAQRQAELGTPESSDGETSPRRLVAEALTYWQNHKDKMRYDDYRRQGLPLTSSHMESLMKQINQRVKGTEKFWREEGAEAILQLRADILSDNRPLDAFWERREATQTGQRRYSKVA